MVNDGEVTRDELVFKHRSFGNLDFVALVGNDNHCAAQSDVAAKYDIALHGQMVQLDHLRDRLESLLELRYLLESVAEFDDWCLREHSSRVHYQLSVFQ